MNKYKVYFEMYGKKMVATIEAYSLDDAQEIIRDKIIFHKVECISGEEPSKPKKDFDFGKDLRDFLGI